MITMRYCRGANAPLNPRVAATGAPCTPPRGPRRPADHRHQSSAGHPSSLHAWRPARILARAQPQPAWRTATHAAIHASCKQGSVVFAGTAALARRQGSRGRPPRSRLRNQD
ncbi:hypothetical protein GUJ93_ZPchr0007g4968 [Zizania palustris]|uniref:Uncharacterized protein n=1 Tax=Zizania palustris TaxID=103762 RepID=A0A8J5SSH7_ZIZPA|nr:hypothetical protein GUJ93_ZPchr0007g4968 [Zizania palustris]